MRAAHGGLGPQKLCISSMKPADIPESVQQVSHAESVYSQADMQT